METVHGPSESECGSAASSVSYSSSLQDSLLLMDDRLLSLGELKLPSKSSDNSVDIQWLSPIDRPLLTKATTDDRFHYRFDGSTSLRLFTCHSDITGNDIRQYFIEDLFRSMLIRLNLALINSEGSAGESAPITKLILPRRIYVNRPVFISAYQLVHEPLSTAVESLQENFKITSIMEEDLEAAEEFPPEITNDERVKQFNTNMNDSKEARKDQPSNAKSLYQNLLFFIENQVGTGNAVLVALLTTIAVALLAVMIKFFT